jgi:hypothetical protein
VKLAVDLYQFCSYLTNNWKSGNYYGTRNALTGSEMEAAGAENRPLPPSTCEAVME